MALSCVAETKVVASGAPARRTCAPPANPTPFTEIANAPAGTAAGAMLDKTGVGFQIVTVALAVALELVAVIAVTVTVFLAGTTAGAVYVPAALIVPVADAPPSTPFTCHATTVFDVPETVALKFCVAPERTSALVGAILTVTPVPDGGVLEFEPDELAVVPVQPDKTTNIAEKARNRYECF